jgi:isopenicillin-N N-acyltransferase-like protein
MLYLQWLPEQKQNIIGLTIVQDGLPTIKCITEAGMIGKIGLNAAGVGVCFNAIRARGMDDSRMPVHLGLRVVLESSSAKDALAHLEEVGMASPAHMLIGDASFATGLEFTSSTFAQLPVDARGRVIHSNHLLLPHPGGGYEPFWLEDSPIRIDVMEKNTAAVTEPLSAETFSRQFEDETNYPGAICRKAEGKIDSETLFNIVMDLRGKTAVVKIGRPVDVEEVINFTF